MQVRVLAAARRDLREIWYFGCDRWGERPTDAYSDTLDAMIGSLGENPLKGPMAPEIGFGLRRMVVRSHVVFYQVIGDAVEVVRVLHQSVDAGKRVG